MILRHQHVVDGLLCFIRDDIKGPSPKRNPSLIPLGKPTIKITEQPRSKEIIEYSASPKESDLAYWERLTLICGMGVVIAFRLWQNK